MKEELRKDIRDIQKVVKSMEEWLKQHPRETEIPINKLKIEDLSNLRICELVRKYDSELNGSYIARPTIGGERHAPIFAIRAWKVKK